MIDEPPWPFLMTPRQHREWAENARRRKRPDLAQHHEQIARVIGLLTTGSLSSSDNRRI
jgi:hypothetical protein